MKTRLLSLCVLTAVVLVSPVCSIAYDLLTTKTVSVSGLTVQDPKAIVDKPLQSRKRFLIANLEGLKGVITTDEGKHKAFFRGAIGFEVVSGTSGEASFRLVKLNLMSKGCPTCIEDTGMIGLKLAKAGYKASYDPQYGVLKSTIRSELHYDLIDEVVGHKEVWSGEDVTFIPYTETMKGVLKGTLSMNNASIVSLDKDGGAIFEGKVILNLEDRIYGKIPRVVVTIPPCHLIVTREPCEVLRVQPVFVGTGPSDPDATGWAFDQLINNAQDLWRRCGSERRIKFLVLPPMYVDNDAYRIIDDHYEGFDFMGEVLVDDAIEVFVAERFVNGFGGGGFTLLDGSAIAKIITCDEQLDVSCDLCDPCGEVNRMNLAHELGHVLGLDHPGDRASYETSPQGSVGSVMEPSGFCDDNPNRQSAHNCRSASNPLLYYGFCYIDTQPDPDIMD